MKKDLISHTVAELCDHSLENDTPLFFKLRSSDVGEIGFIAVLMLPRHRLQSHQVLIDDIKRTLDAKYSEFYT